MRFAFFLLLLFFSSCSRPLQVQTQYITHDYLASSRIESPDPKLTAPLLKKRILIRWDVANREELSLKLLLLKRNFKQETICFSIPPTKKSRSKGTITYDLPYENLCSSEELIAYKVELVSQEELIADWVHPLWVPVIRFEEP